jgi:AP-3 complex subunit beta
MLVCSVDGEQKEMLIELISELLSGNEPTVLGSALFAFKEVCPNRWDLLHPHFRKVCHLLADFDEWGQTIALELLLRYGRNQFTSPLSDEDQKSVASGAASTSDLKPPAADPNKPFYSDDEDEASAAKKEEAKAKKAEVDAAKEKEMDPDHKLLLRCASILVHSTNSAVVVGIANIFYYLAPMHECTRIAGPLVRAARNKREIAYVMYATIATLASTRPVNKAHTPGDDQTTHSVCCC